MKPNKFSPSTFRHRTAKMFNGVLSDDSTLSQWFMMFKCFRATFHIKKRSNAKFLMVKCRVKRHQSWKSEEKKLVRRFSMKAFELISRWHLFHWNLTISGMFLVVKLTKRRFLAEHDFVLVSISPSERSSELWKTETTTMLLDLVNLSRSDKRCWQNEALFLILTWTQCSNEQSRF